MMVKKSRNRLFRYPGLIAVALSVGLVACNNNDDDGNEGDTTAGTNITTTGDGPANIGVPTGDDAAGFSEGVVTAANPIAAEAGAQVLRDGGNAIDAAVVVQFVLNVVEPTSSGIGGGGFMGIHRPETGRTFFIDSREKAPAAATPTQYLNCEPDCTGEETRDDRLGSFTALYRLRMPWHRPSSLPRRGLR